MRDTLTAILRRDYRVTTAGSAEAAQPLLRAEPVDLMLLDVRLPGMNGIDLLRLVKDQHPMIEVIVISAVSEVETAVQAMKLGAYHYITKDFEYDALRSLVRNASEEQDLNRRVLTLSAQVAEQCDREFITGPGRAMREALELAQKVAPTPATVLLLGESGTGKELVAQMIHRESPRRDGPFMPVNLSAVPSELVESLLFGHERGAFTGAHRQQLGKFELAAGGTLFLDEIPALVEKYKQGRLTDVTRHKRPPKPATINRELACLKTIFNKAMKNGKAERNPAQGVKLLKEINIRDRILSPEEFTLLLTKSPEHLKPLLKLGYHTGMRQGEIMSLTWGQVDLKEGFIHLKPEDCKTNEGREVPLTQELVAMFKAMPRGLPGVSVFTLHEFPRGAFLCACKKAGIEGWPGCRRIRPRGSPIWCATSCATRSPGRRFASGRPRARRESARGARGASPVPDAPGIRLVLPIPSNSRKDDLLAAAP